MKTKEDYPLVLDATHVQEILGIGRRQSYNILNEVELQIRRKKEAKFNVIRVGKLLRVPRDPFFSWLDGQKKN